MIYKYGQLMLLTKEQREEFAEPRADAMIRRFECCIQNYMLAFCYFEDRNLNTCIRTKNSHNLARKRS